MAVKLFRPLSCPLSRLRNNPEVARRLRSNRRGHEGLVEVATKGASGGAGEVLDVANRMLGDDQRDQQNDV